VEDIDASRERALFAQEELNNRLSEQINKVTTIEPEDYRVSHSIFNPD